MAFTIKRFDELTKTELYDILALRLAVFVVEQNCPYQDLDGKDQDCLHVCFYEDGELAAYARLFSKGVMFEQASIGRVIVAEKHRGKDLGRRLMQTCISYILEEMGESQIQISAQKYLDAFYESLGFVAISEVYLEDGIPHQDMLLDKK
ncbi:GNAT family N-acetyltransferase [Streptococcus cameli]